MKTFKTKKGTELPISDIKGKDYLQVAYRVVWFREEHPLWSISTVRVEGDGQSALFKAEILDEEKRVLSTGHKREHLKHFGDFEEKAETGAIGRALANLGFGTQFSPEFEEGDRIVDSPKERVSEPSDQTFSIGKEIRGKRFSEKLGDKKFIKWVNDTLEKEGERAHKQLLEFHKFAKMHGALEGEL